jgi:hypothetical protein
MDSMLGEDKELMDQSKWQSGTRIICCSLLAAYHRMAGMEALPANLVSATADRQQATQPAIQQISGGGELLEASGQVRPVPYMAGMRPCLLLSCLA